MQLRTHHPAPFRVVAYSLAAAVVVAIVALGITLQMQSKPTVYAVCNGKAITDLEEAQQQAQESLSLLSETFADLNTQH